MVHLRLLLSAAVSAQLGHGLCGSGTSGTAPSRLQTLRADATKLREENVRADAMTSTQHIAKGFEADQVLVFTVATGYFLAQTVFQLVFSHLSHGMGSKYAYITGVSLFVLGAIVAAISKTPEQLIGARVIQGIGAAGMFTMSAIVVVDIMQPRQRAAWTALSQACGALGNICGPLFTGLLFKKYTWVS